MVKGLSWAVVVGEGIDEDEVEAEVNDEDKIEEIDVAVLELVIEAELDREEIDVIGVADVVKEGIAVVVSGVEATDDETGEVEPPKVHSDPNGIYSRRLKHFQHHFLISHPHLDQSKSMANRQW